MRSDDFEILTLFQFELRLLEDGGHGRSPRRLRGPSTVFQDSLICPNFAASGRPHPCAHCSLLEFVPAQFRGESAPCRFIPLTDAGETADELFWSRAQIELEEALACWLHKQISRMNSPTE